MSINFPLQRISSALLNHSAEITRRLAFSFIGTRRGFDARDALVICADPRGGSTWLYEILSGIDNVAGLWEPLHIGKVGQFKKLGFGWRHYISENDTFPGARAAFQRLFEGACRDPYILHRTTFREFREADHLLTKFCRATQLLPWLTREFKFNNKPVHLVRHPCAIVASQLRYGAWDSVKPGFSEHQIMSDPLMSIHSDILLGVDNIESRLAAVWAMTNSVALNHPQRNERWLTISYEDLVTNPADTLALILNDWGLTLDDSIDEIIVRPSRTTLNSSPVALGKTQKQLSYWQSSLTDKQIHNVLDTVNAFGIDIYGEGVMPSLK